MDNHKGVLVCGEIAEGKLAPITIELLGVGRKLANELGEDLSTLLMSSKTGGLGQEAIAYGADKVYVAEDSLPATRLLVSTRPVFGGNAHATVVSRSARPQMATLRAKIVPPAERNDSRQGQVIPVEGKIDPSALKVRVVDRIKEEVEGVKLEDAEGVVSGGRGKGSAQNAQLV